MILGYADKLRKKQAGKLIVRYLTAKLYEGYLENLSLRIGFAGVLLMLWLSTLYYSDSFFSSYVFFAVIGVVAYTQNIKTRNRMPQGSKVYIVLFCVLFTWAIVLANYSLLIPFNLKKVTLAGLMLVTGYLIPRNTFICCLNRKNSLNKMSISMREKHKPYAVFFTAFFSILAADLLCLYFYNWPGIITLDSRSQIEQVLQVRAYSNHHPFFHTMIIKVCIDLGMALFGDINSAVAVYSVVQTICMAGVFAFAIMTLYQAGVSKGWLLVALLTYALIPYHVLYSITMWKDVLFGGVTVLYACSLYRIIKCIGSAKTSFATLIIGALGTCLLRSNGFLALLLTFVVMTVVLGKKYKRVILAILIVLVISFVMKHCLLKMLDVSQPDTAEFLSIPEQQVARLIVEEVDMTEEEVAQISKVMDIDQVKKDYLPYISDPVKKIIRNTGLDYLSAHKSDYLDLYLKLGYRYPGIYLRAWIDQTKGYWNGGYEYWVAANGIVENNQGLNSVTREGILQRVMDTWFGLFFHNNAFELFRSIGLHVWAIFFSMTVMIVEKRKEAVICVLLLAIVMSLLVSTPVFSEFRYAYSIFTAFPFVVLITFAVPEMR